MSYRDPADKHKYFDNDEMWENAQRMLKAAVDDMGVEYYEAEGEAAFYGRKHALALSAVVQSHPVYVLFKIALADKSCQRVLLEGGYRT